jgi:hypothetical protein
VTCDESVEGVGHAPADHAVSDERAVAAREAPAGEALGLWERGEQRRRCGVVERQDRQAPAGIEAGDDTRRPAAEASARVVQEDRALDAQRALSNPSRVARTSGPIVSST